jgi:hypothetical protein
LKLRYLFEFETEMGIPFPTDHCPGNMYGGLLIGSDIKFHRSLGRNVHLTHHATPSEGQVQYETLFDAPAVRGNKAFEMDNIPWVFSVLHCGYHSHS